MDNNKEVKTENTINTRKKSGTKRIILGLGVLVAIAIIIGTSYAYLRFTATQETVNKVNSDCLKLTLAEEADSAINLEKAYPITDEEAQSLHPYQFKIKNECTLSIQYDVNLEIMSASNRLNSEFVAVDFNGEGKRILSNFPTVPATYKDSTYTAEEARGLKTGVLQAGEEINYTLKLWMDESVTIEDDAMNKTFISKISVNGSLNQIVDVYKEDILNGADPVLGENLIPVRIAKDGTVTKANIETEWYNYANKVWANAVILVDKTQVYNNYDVIPEENIESYFVWIPKYSYELFDLGDYNSTLAETPTDSIAKSINIKFGTADTNDSNTGECTTPMNAERTQGLSGESGNCQVGDYMTHPAFISMNTNGLWVGKFETTGSTSNLTVKPNIASLRNINVMTMFTTAYNYQRNLDSHMMKNTEWGAVAYLLHSIYGINTEVNINNNSGLLTGYSATEGSVQTSYPGTSGTSTDITQPYNTTTGYKASTTGNISGIYDMSGGAWEYMASYIENIFRSSGFTQESIATYDDKYFDVYNGSSSTTTYNYRILGDATGEIGPFYNYKDKDGNSRYHNNWYADISYFVDSYDPWFRRGGDYEYGVLAGQFYILKGTGTSHSTSSFHLVLAI